MSTAASIPVDVNKLETPSKWDIIPLHTSDRTTFKDCRRKWFWSSPAQSNLVRKASVYGIYEPFWFGNGIHFALEKFYDPRLKEDPEIAFDYWYDLQWNGGYIKESELEQFKDRKPDFDVKKKAWYVEGLSTVLPFPDEEHYENLHQIGMGMMRFYKDYAEREDDFTVIATEHMFSVPILDPTTGRALYMLDNREMPDDWESTDVENEYGRLVLTKEENGYHYKQVHARGRQDLIVLGNTTGNFAIMDHKTSTGPIDEDYFRHVDLDEQCTTYLWAAEIEARMYDLPYKEMAGIVYQGLRKAYPRLPTITTRGVPSLDRQKETTTAYLFDKTIKEMGLTNLFNSDEKMQAYYNYLVEMGDKQFVNRKDVLRNKHQKENAGLRIYMEALDMLDNPRIYPNPRKEYSCLNCMFRQPCIAVEAGYDYEGMIQDGYESNFDR